MLQNLTSKFIKVGRILIFLPILFSYQLKAKEVDTLRSNFIKKIDLPVNAEEQILSYLNRNLLFVTSNEILQNQKVIWMVDLNKPKSISKIKFDKPINSKYSITAIGASNKKIILICHDSILIYKIEKDQASLIFTMANTNSFLEVEFSENNNIIVLNKLYNFHPNDQKICCQYLYLKADDLEELANDTIEYGAIAYSHQIQKWQNFNSWQNYSLLALTTKNKILRFNRLHQFDTIYLPINEKVLVPDSLLHLTFRGKQLVKHLISNDINYNRIEKIFERNDTIIVSEIFPGSGKDYRLLTYCFKIKGIWTFKEFIYRNSQIGLNLSYSEPTYVYDNQVFTINQNLVKNTWKRNKFIHSLYFYELKP